MNETPQREYQELRIPKASELVADHLRRLIIHHELAEGEPLPAETQLIAMFQVSRPTLREAYRILESEGLLTVRRGPNGGARVHKPQPDVAARYASAVLQTQGARLTDVFDARTILEGPVAKIYAESWTAEGLSSLRAINAEAALLVGKLHEQRLVHAQFHKTMLELAGNKTLVLLEGMLGVILDGVDFGLIEHRALSEIAAPDIAVRSQATHVRLVDLIEQGAVDEVDHLWRAHLAEPAGLIKANLDERATLRVDQA